MTAPAVKTEVPRSSLAILLGNHCVFLPLKNYCFIDGMSSYHTPYPIPLILKVEGEREDGPGSTHAPAPSVKQRLVSLMDEVQPSTVTYLGAHWFSVY